jgi:integrase
MARFSVKSPEQQALSVAKDFTRSNALDSIRTIDNYRGALESVAKNMQQYGIGDSLRGMTPETANSYLEIRAEEVRQSQLNMERQAIQCMMHNVSKVLEKNDKLDASIKSKLETIEASRSYTPEQVHAIASAQTERNALATEIAHAAGLRAHELLTLQRREERTPSDRPALESKFNGRNGVRYTVQGKGGLVREVVLPHSLSARLEDKRLDTANIVNDRGINYRSQYDIAGGQRWSNSFSAASNRALGWSSGAHGVRHSYAQERMSELQNQRLNYTTRLETVSQEMGHFRPDITEVYLR